MLKIQLHQLIFYGTHGVYQEEQQIANAFEVNLDLSYDEAHNRFERLEEVIDYTQLYEMIKRRLEIPSLLLEKLCSAILEDLKARYPFVKSIRISVFKLHMPLENFQGRIGVEISKDFD